MVDLLLNKLFNIEIQQQDYFLLFFFGSNYCRLSLLFSFYGYYSPLAVAYLEESLELAGVRLIILIESLNVSLLNIRRITTLIHSINA